MKKDRRKFIQAAGAVAAGSFLLPTWACQSGDKKSMANGAKKAMENITKGSLDKFGIQLYTLRDVITKDPKATLKRLAQFGFNQIESYDGPQGLFWNMKNTEFKTFLDDLGLSLASAACKH